MTSENKFECLACGKKYKFKSGLYKHRANCTYTENIITENVDFSKEKEEKKKKKKKQK